MTTKRLYRLLPAGVFLATALLYLATLTHVHTFDALSYVVSVERKPWAEVLHPHHLAYGPLGVLALAAGRALGFAGGAALPMQVLNALAGALGASLFCRVVLRATARADLALACAALLASSYAYWYYAVEIEVYTVAVLFLVACLWLIAGDGRPGAWRMGLLGLAQGAGVLFHQTNVLLCVPIAAWYLLAQRPAEAGGAGDPSGARRLPGPPLAYAAALALSVAIPYLWAGFGVSGFRSWGEFAAWMTEYARTGWWGGPLTAQKLAGLGQGLAETLTPVGGGWIWLGLLGAAAAGLLIGRRAAGQRPARPLVAGLACWLLAYGGFFFWWEPDNIEFWIASLPPALLLLALALARLRAWGPATWLALALAGAMLWLNGAAIRQRGDPATDLQRTVARALAERSTPADLLIVPDGLQELYLPYYERRENFVSLNQALFEAGGDWDAACAGLRGRIDTALYAGAHALIAGEALRPPPELAQRFGITQAQVDGCFAALRPDLRPLDLPAQVPAYWRTPGAQELLEGGGWRFERSSLGWRAANVSGERFGGGWHFAPGSDPGLTSPLVQIDTARYRAITIRLANRTAAGDAQLFFLGQDGRADEARSLRWQLEPGPEAHTYRLDLRGAPGWDGVVTRLRIDPVGVGDGGELTILEVRLEQ